MEIFDKLVSGEVLRELREAPEAVQNVLRNLPPAMLGRADIGPEVRALADAYVAANVLGPASWADAVHVAAATAAEADMIVSWNFRHIVNFDRIQKYNAVNILNGYGRIAIISPLEVAYGNEEDV